ncbi:MAG TPA: hypothetical protein VKV28_04825 [Candidatus Binataceae bacterium]|nr:hypothetical protein [Candidatus Binataceae bacterium]
MARSLTFSAGELPAKYNSGSSYKSSDVVIAVGPVRVWGVSGYNSSASPVWVMLFDASTVPANGAAPDVLIYAAAQSGFGWQSAAAALGSGFSNGLCWAQSTSAPQLSLATGGAVYLRADFD